MGKMRYLMRFPPRFYSRRIINLAATNFSTVPAENIAGKSKIQEHIELGNLTTVISKERTKLPQREPFVKNLFLGKVDTEILAYPELSKQDVDELETAVNSLEKISKQLDSTVDIRETLRIMGGLKCLGLQCSHKIGGRELNTTEHCRFNEILFKNSHKYSLLNNELCIYIISKYGKNDQKDKYLQKLLKGEIVSTISIANNSSGSDEDSPKELKANLQNDFKSYMLNGEKRYVLSGADADLFIIFLRDADGAKDNFENSDLLAFIIEKNTPGISLETVNTDESLLKGTVNVVFKDVIVPKSNIIGSDKNVLNVLSKVLPEYHLNISVMNLNLMKTLVSSLSDDIIKSSPPGQEVYQTEAITSVMGEILSYIYIVESMVYLTSGMISNYEDQDCDVESLITRVFSTELALKSTSLGFSLLGGNALDSKNVCQKLHKEALAQLISYENANMAKLMIGLLGIQYSGRKLGGTVKKLRNPLFHGSFVLKKLWQGRRHGDDDPALTLEIKNYLHPSCQEAANDIEYCVLRLQYATETFLSKYGIDVLNCHNHLRRLSESVMYIYAMIACLSRASRSYCIGLENNDSEMLLANVVCRHSYKHVRALLNDVIEECLIMDDPLKILSENLYKKKNYYLTHPLTRNF